MRFLIIDVAYLDFLDSIYRENPELRFASFEEQMRARMSTLFLFSNAYSSALRQLGHETLEVNFNNVHAQTAWANENGLQPRSSSVGRPATLARGKLRGIIGLHLRRLGLQSSRRTWLLRVLEAQIESYRPDVLLNYALEEIPPKFLRRVRSHVGRIIGQHAVLPTPATLKDPTVYDLVVSSSPPTVEKFRRVGVRSELLRLYFDPRVLEHVPTLERTIDVSFVGSLFQSLHVPRIQFLEELAGSVPQLKIWGPVPRGLSKNSPLHACYQGPAWGSKMFEVLAASKITLNHHGTPAFANNLRLYEGTGMGSLLITDEKPDLHEIFELNGEVVPFSSAKDAAEKIDHFLASPDEAERIAAAGQARTLRDHTPFNRVTQLLGILETVS